MFIKFCKTFKGTSKPPSSQPSALKDLSKLIEHIPYTLTMHSIAFVIPNEVVKKGILAKN